MPSRRDNYDSVRPRRYVVRRWRHHRQLFHFSLPQITGIITISFTFTFLDIWINFTERPLRRNRIRLQRWDYPDYVYKPLDKSKPKSIRLIERVQLSDADIDKGIYGRIKMRTASLEGPDAEPYEAISY